MHELPAAAGGQGASQDLGPAHRLPRLSAGAAEMWLAGLEGLALVYCLHGLHGV